MLDASQIQILSDDEVITEPGFYQMSLDRHHNQPCDGPSVTSGTLRKMENETPADVWAFHKLNPNRWPSDDSVALRMGRAMAAYIEGGPELLEDVVRVLPANKPKRPTPLQIKAYAEGRATEAGTKSVEFWAKIDADPRDKITEDQWEQITTMGDVLAKDPAASAALGGVPEITMAWKDERNDLWCLARPDQISFSGMLSDYKTTSTRGQPFNHRLIDRRITEYGYHMQMAFAAEGFQALTGMKPEMIGLVFQLSTPPHHVVLRAIDDEAISIGTFQNQRARRCFRECLDSGFWPSPSDDIGSYHMPDWYRERLINEMQTEGTAP
jgi:hypothetical protein